MIVKAGTGCKRKFLGISFEVLSAVEQSMITKMHYNAKDKVPLHSHDSEQTGYVLSGIYNVTIESTTTTRIETGDSYVITGNVNHSLEVIEPGIILDIFSPPRKDYL